MVRLECVPNVSEGRCTETVNACARAVQAPGVKVLDVSSDRDHNRTVLTLLGEANALVEAVRSLAKVAMDRINLQGHSGVHPRLGALDVAPFVPLASLAPVTPVPQAGAGDAPAGGMSAAVSAARRAGAALADLGPPVFLYGEAAATPERGTLANHRRGGLKRLAERMASGAWKPDLGPHRPHRTAGVFCVGARPPLVAFNLLLDTDRVAVARRIAASLREAGGGPPGVRALGFLLGSRRQAQVSVNLTDCERTTLLDVVERASELARQTDTRVVETELVGLAPRCVVPPGAAEALRLPDLPPEKILETHLERPHKHLRTEGWRRN